MQKKPDLRYENASALVLDLRRAVSDPDGDYVVLEEETDDSPTIMLGDDVVQAVKDNKKHLGTEEHPACR